MCLVILPAFRTNLSSVRVEITLQIDTPKIGQNRKQRYYKV